MRQPVYKKEKSELKPAVLCLKINLELYLARGGEIDRSIDFNGMSNRLQLFCLNVKESCTLYGYIYNYV